MKLRVVMLLLGCTVVPTPGAQPLLLQPSQSVYAGGTPLDPRDHTIPCMADGNGDGLLDLVAGYQPAIKVAVYLNSGNATEPVFGSCENLQAAGMDIFLPSSGCGSPAPWVCDYDGDGKRDLLVGAGADGRVWFYRNISAGANPILASGVDVQTNGATLSVGIRIIPTWI